MKKKYRLIPAFKKYYPEIEDLDYEQLEFCKFFKQQTNSFTWVDIGADISYGYLYVNELIEESYKCNFRQTNEVIEKLEYLKKKNPNINLDFLIGDLNLLNGNIEESIDCYNLDPKKIDTHRANKKLNVKYKYDYPMTGEDLLCISKKTTKYGLEHIHQVKDEINIQLDEYKQISNSDLIQYIGNKYVEMRICPINFLDGWTNRHSKREIVAKLFDFDFFYCFYAIDELLKFAKKASRLAENAVRTKNKVPKIGEGWISETELYNNIKTAFKEFNVVQHASPSWLGRQHLDVFLPEMKIAIEYQGEQHYRAIDFFGGEEAFKKTVKRDRAKKSKCIQNGVLLIEVKKGYDLNKLVEKIKTHNNR